MIRSTFILLNGISYGKESRLWGDGIKDWNDFLHSKKVKGISKKRKLVYDYHLSQANRGLLNEDSYYFASILPMKEHWRLYDYFNDSCVFLDIEMSCVSGGYITCMTLFDGYDTMTFVRNQNMDSSIIQKILSRYKIIVTYNGNVFDLPFLKKYFGDIVPNVLCWDLRHSCAALGLKGGLKEVEKELGIKRENEIVERMHGGDPLKLWRTFLATGDKYYLDLLVEYNQEDTINLKFIADKVFKMLVEKMQITI